MRLNESPLNAYNKIKEGTYNNRPINIGKDFVSPLMRDYFDPFERHDLASSPKQLTTYTTELLDILPALTPFIAGQTGKDILFSLHQNMVDLPTQDQEIIQPVRQALLTFFTNNMTTFMDLAHNQRDIDEENKMNELLLPILNDTMQYGSPTQKQLALTTFQKKHQELMHVFSHPTQCFKETPLSFLQSIKIVFDNPELEFLRSSTVQLLEQARDNTTILVKEYSNAYPVADYAAAYLRNLIADALQGKDTTVLDHLFAKLTEMGVADPQALVEKWKYGKSQTINYYFDKQTQLIQDNYEVARTLHNREEGSVGILANIFNISSFYRFASHEDRLLSLCEYYENAQQGVLPHNPSLIFLAAWDDENSKVFGLSTRYNSNLDNNEQVLQKFTGLPSDTIYFEVHNSEDLLRGLITMPTLFGQFVSGSIHAHGNHASVKFGEGNHDELQIMDLFDQQFQQAFLRAYAPHSPITVNACMSSMLAEQLSVLGFTTVGFLTKRECLNADEFVINQDSIRPTRRDVAMYHNGTQIHEAQRR